MSNVLMTIIFVLVCALLIVAKVCDERTEENKRLIENLMIARNERDTYRESAEHWFSAYREQQKEIVRLKSIANDSRDKSDFAVNCKTKK